MSFAEEKIVLQERDLSLFRGLFESRILTSKHIAILFFDGKREAAKKRLQKLKASGFIAERGRRPFEPGSIFLTRKGVSSLRDKGILAEYPELNPESIARREQISDLTLRHELEVIDVRCAFHSSITQSNTFHLAEFNTWPILNRFEASTNGFDRIQIYPDSFLRIQESMPTGHPIEYSFFLELDRSTEVLETLVRRVSAYIDHYKSGNFAMRKGILRVDSQRCSFRLLIILQTKERRNLLIEKLLKLDRQVLRLPFLSTFKEVIEAPLSQIWLRPSDYRNAIQGTDFEQIEPTWGYKRDTPRDRFVDARAIKVKLLPDHEI